MGPEEKPVTRDDVWHEMNVMKAEQSEIKTSVAALTSKFDSFLTMFQSNRPQPVNWTAIVTVAILTLGACATWVNHNDKRLHEDAKAARLLHASDLTKVDARFERLISIMLDDMSRRSDQRAEDAHAHGSLEAEVTDLKERQDLLVAEQVKDIENRGRSEAVDDMSINWINKVDNMGSRVHVKPSWKE